MNISLVELLLFAVSKMLVQFGLEGSDESTLFCRTSGKNLLLCSRIILNTFVVSFVQLCNIHRLNLFIKYCRTLSHFSVRSVTSERQNRVASHHTFIDVTTASDRVDSTRNFSPGASVRLVVACLSM